MGTLGYCKDWMLWGWGRDLESLVQIPVLPCLPALRLSLFPCVPRVVGTHTVPLAAPLFLPSPLWQHVPHHLIAYFQLATFPM